MDTPIRVVLADSQRLFVEALTAQLARQSGIEVVGTATTAAGLRDSVHRSRPRVLVSDGRFEDRDVFREVRNLVRQQPDLRLVLLLSSAPEVVLAEAAACAAGCLLKDEPLSVLVSAIRAIAAGETAVSESLASRLRFDRRTRSFRVRFDDPVGSLTSRQAHVLRLFARGLSVREVAKQLFLSEKGAESQRYRLMQRLGLNDRAELALLAMREGFIAP